MGKWFKKLSLLTMTMIIMCTILIPYNVEASKVVKRISQGNQYDSDKSNGNAENHCKVTQCSAEFCHAKAHAGSKNQRTDDADGERCRLSLLGGDGMEPAKLSHFILLFGKISVADFSSHFFLLLLP